MTWLPVYATIVILVVWSELPLVNKVRRLSLAWWHTTSGWTQAGLWLLTLIISGGMAVLTNATNYIYPILAVYLMVVLLKQGRVHVVKSSFLMITILAASFVVIGFFRGHFSPGDVSILVKMVFAFLVVLAMRSYGVRHSFAVLEQLIEVLIVVSLVTWVLGNVLHSHLPVSYVNSIGGQHATLAHIAYFQLNDRYPVLRNESIFWEPGVFAVVIILGYVLKTYALRSTHRTWLYVVGIATTMSLGGILLFLPILAHSFVLEYCEGRSRLRRTLNTLIFGLIILVIVLVSIDPGIFDAVTQLFGRNTGSGSISIRTMDLVYGFLSTLSAPWVGHGSDFGSFYLTTAAAKGVSKAAYNGGITNGITSMMYQYGFIFVAIYVTLLIRSCRILFGRYWWLIGMLLIGCLMEEPLQFSVLFLSLLVMPKFRLRSAEDGDETPSAHGLDPYMALGERGAG